MADDAPQARAPLRGLIRPGRFGAATPRLLIEERTDLALATVLARREKQHEVKHAVVATYGIDLPEGPRVAAANGVSFAGIGVHRWLAAAETST